MEASRTAGIMADSAHVILTSVSRKTTDNFFLDDEVLLSNGMSFDDLSKYLPKGGSTGKLGADFMS